MNIEVTKGKVKCAKKVVIYGPEGIGKSTLASRFPDPLFIDTEGSTNQMDILRLTKPTSWAMLQAEIKAVKDGQFLCKTLVIDTIDWAEQMCVQSICDKHQKVGIEDFGYGNGYVYVKEEFGRFLNLLSEVVEKGINVVLTAHAQMRKFEQPDELGAYDRWELKLGKKTGSQTSPLVKEWCDLLLFCNYKTTVVNVDGQGAQKGKNKVQGGKRVMYTAHHSCWDAKNRFGLPEELPMDYAEIAHIFNEVTPLSKDMQPAPKSVPEPAPEIKETKGPDVSTVMKNEEYAPPAPEPKAQSDLKSQPKEPETEPPEKLPKVNDGFQMYSSDPERIPKALRDLMDANNVCEWNIQEVVGARGYYPKDVLIQDYDPDFIQGVLIAAWEQVYAMIVQETNKQSTPFDQEDK